VETPQVQLLSPDLDCGVATARKEGKADQEEGSVPITAGKLKEFTPIILSKMEFK
jgi:hypothetical protein